MSGSVTYIFNGMSKREWEFRKASMLALISRPTDLVIGSRDKEHIRDSKNTKWGKEYSKWLKEVDSKLENLDLYREVRGLVFQKGKPVTVDYDKLYDRERESLKRKLDALVYNGTLSLHKEKKDGSANSDSGKKRSVGAPQHKSSG